MGASAYDRCDIDRDGTVSIRDVLCMNDFLNGKYSFPSSIDLDINQNKIIDYADSLAIMAKLVSLPHSVKFVDITENLNPQQIVSEEMLAESEFVEGVLFPSEEIAEPYAAVEDSREYYKFDCSKRTYTTYTLEIKPEVQTSSLDANELNSVSTIDGDYYRVNGNGMDGIVYFTVNGSSGTGFIVGDHTIATAAHCVFNYKSTSTNIVDKFYKGAAVTMCDVNGNVIPSKKYTVEEIHIPKGYVDIASPKDSGAASPYDYALVTVSEDLSSYTHFRLGIPSPNYINNMDEVKIFVSGFPDDANKYVSTSVGHESKDRSSNEQRLYYTNDMYAGMSGGPAYTVTDIYENENFRERINTVLAVNTARHVSSLTFEFLYASGTVMNSHLLKFYGVNPNIGY